MSESLADLPHVESVGCALAIGQPSAGCEKQQVDASGPTGPPKPPATIRAFEHALIALGFTKRQAAAIATHGFKAAPLAADEARAQLDKLRAAIEKRGEPFKE